MYQDKPIMDADPPQPPVAASRDSDSDRLERKLELLSLPYRRRITLLIAVLEMSSLDLFQVSINELLKTIANKFRKPNDTSRQYLS